MSPVAESRGQRVVRFRIWNELKIAPHLLWLIDRIDPRAKESTQARVPLLLEHRRRHVNSRGLLDCATQLIAAVDLLECLLIYDDVLVPHGERCLE